MDVELAHEVLPMFVHRFEAHAQFRGDLFVGLAFGNQLERLHLARAEVIILLFEFPSSLQRRLLAAVEALGNGWTVKGISLLHLANSRGEDLRGSLFEQESRGA